MNVPNAMSLRAAVYADELLTHSVTSDASDTEDAV